jgi:predicted RNase H-like HicB family nuclease
MITKWCWSDEDQCYVVTLPARQNARTHGRTLKEVVRNAREVLALLIDSAKRHGEPIPPAEKRFSGNLRLRLPVSLSRAIGARGRARGRQPEPVDRE